MWMRKNGSIYFSVIRPNKKKTSVTELDYECLICNSRNLNDFATDLLAMLGYEFIACGCLF